MTPHCKLCFDVKNTGYNTHNVRDTENNITCPYLLSINCRNCGVAGHTASYCSAPKKNNQTKTINTVKHIVIPEPEPKPEPNLCDHLKSMKAEVAAVLNDDLPPITAIKWGIGFVGKSGIFTHSWADEAEREQEYRRKKTAGMSWARITAA